MFKTLWFFFNWSRQLQLWVTDYIFRVDNGLWEIEREYGKRLKGLHRDANYNQLQGKFTALVVLAQDFKIPIPNTDRINRRIKQRGGKTIIAKRAYKSLPKARGVSKIHR